MTYLWQFACSRVGAMSARICWHWRMLHVNHFFFVTLNIITPWIIAGISRGTGSSMMIILMRGGVMFGTVAWWGISIRSSMLETFFNFFLTYATIFRCGISWRSIFQDFPCSRLSWSWAIGWSTKIESTIGGSTRNTVVCEWMICPRISTLEAYDHFVCVSGLCWVVYLIANFFIFLLWSVLLGIYAQKRFIGYFVRKVMLSLNFLFWVWILEHG